MPERPLLVFDFDGVLVDGMVEYWWSARRAALALVAGDAGDRGTAAPGDWHLPEQAPPGFALLRPLIHKGWEMVLMAAELGRPDIDLDAALADYETFLGAALRRWGWTTDQLQQALEGLRAEAIATDLDAWLALHRFYPGVEARLRRLAAEGADWAVLTTKGGAFAARLLAAAGLTPLALYGHEQGSKPSVLARLLAGHDPAARPLWFVEDRRPTLELVRRTPGLEAVRCYLVSWGYLGPGDGEGLAPLGIRWLEPAGFEAPLALWP
ncbi:HAD family hydrolase [Cyanobium sp. N.Huapi 1H5]|uniref:HAD family hydrolase n=1 Tax=Cyanobium sp. N.Huapi 1H5 TaxID=2823719 RepID=UPI0020CC7756|nr:HAD family hydrolase [Cyanobium sp. N.Huapi 1H5]MCP9837311.1 HAD family hydrolase [Cyanobium sp. N.Huapi 1H5]